MTRPAARPWPPVPGALRLAGTELPLGALPDAETVLAACARADWAAFVPGLLSGPHAAAVWRRLADPADALTLADLAAAGQAVGAAVLHTEWWAAVNLAAACARHWHTWCGWCVSVGADPRPSDPAVALAGVRAWLMSSCQDHKAAARMHELISRAPTGLGALWSPADEAADFERAAARLGATTT